MGLGSGGKRGNMPQNSNLRQACVHGINALRPTYLSVYLVSTSLEAMIRKKNSTYKHQRTPS